MKYLYVDNYRGFSNLYIPLKDVNFLIGENSTGKSSILAILSLITKYKFWFDQNFNDTDIQLGMFKDIISARSENTSNFKIGMINLESNPEDSFCFLAIFSEQEGQPSISRFHYSINTTETSIFFLDSVEYSINQIDGLKQTLAFYQSLFERWMTIKKTRKNIQNIKSEFGIQNSSLVYVIHNVENDIRRQSEDKEPRSVRRPFLSCLHSAFGEVVWLAPIRSKPKRTYDDYKSEFSSDGSHIPYLIKKILGASSTKASEFKSFMKRFGLKSGLMDSISIQKYGTDDYISPFGLLIELNDIKLNLNFVGYGVSQVLPVIVEVYEGKKRSWYAIQQPEVHLHPRAQAALGDLFFDQALKEKKKFMIETHSDYMIDRFRVNLSKQPNTLSAQSLFFHRKENSNVICAIDIGEDGQYSLNQPEEFRDFFINEELSNLGLK